MAFDADIEERLYPYVRGVPELLRKTMFGGPAYLLHGNMCVGVYKHFLILRLGSERYASMQNKHEELHPMDITGKPMKGWGMIDGYACEDDAMAELVTQAIAFVRTLPAKKK